MSYSRSGGSGNGGLCGVSGTSIVDRPPATTDIPVEIDPTRMAPSADMSVTLRVCRDEAVIAPIAISPPAIKIRSDSSVSAPVTVIPPGDAMTDA